MSGNPTLYHGVTCTYTPDDLLTSYGDQASFAYRGDGVRVPADVVGLDPAWFSEISALTG